MNNLKNVRLVVRENTVSFHADVKPDPVTGEHSGLERISFFFTLEEFGKFDQYTKSFSDIGHQLLTSGGICMFYDLHVGHRKSAGALEVKYVETSIPMFVRKTLKRWVLKVLKTREDNKEIELSLSEERINLLMRNYGCGKGKAELVFTSPEVKEKFDNLVKKGDTSKHNSLRNRVNNLLEGLKSNTSRFWEKYELRISNDSHGFFFVRPGYHGGIINHGTEENPDWSIHT